MIGDENRTPIRIDVRDSSNKVGVLAIHAHKPEKTASFLSFPYVCPEPVLAK
jgi:hypothetical protein